MSDAEYPLAGKVASVTGAARGQGRSHCVRLARAGGFAFVDLQDVTLTQTGARLRSEQQTVSRPVRGESEVALARDVTAVPAISTTNLITRPATRMVP